MNEHLTHWKLDAHNVACGHRSTFMNACENIEFVTCPACRAVWQEILDRVVAMTPVRWIDRKKK